MRHGIGRSVTTALLSLGLGCVLAAAPAHATGEDRYAGVREQFVLTYTALQAGLPAPADIDGDALRAYPLYPYLEAARLTRALSRADAGIDARVREFVDRHDGEPVGRTVRRSWLSSLAARERWSMLLEAYRDDVASDTLRCQYLRARVELEHTDGLASELIEQWRAPRQLPSDCERGFQWLRDQGLMSDELVEQRARGLLANGQAAFGRVIARRLPADRAAPLLTWADLIEQPRRTIDAVITSAPNNPIETFALQDGWMRLARSNPQPALERFPQLVSARGYDDTSASPYALRLALGLAWDRRPEALDYFARTRPADVDDYALEWQARAALWAGDWVRVQQSIAAMSEAQQGLTRWRYWSARAAEARGDDARARSLYRSVLPTDNFYAAIAAARLGLGATPHPEPLQPDPSRREAIEELPPFERARELLRAGLRAQAIAEWYHGLGALDDVGRREAIAIATDWRWYDVAVATATRQSVFNDYALLYPRPYDSEIARAAELGSHRPELLYAIVRQESLYRADAVSPAGAIGLAQLITDTARRTARQWNMAEPRRIDLFDPAVNLAISAAHLRDLIEQFDGQSAVALAGYNAGPNAARRWLPNDPLAIDIWIENIPFNETREYVQRVLWHSVVFSWLATGQAQDTQPWTGTVQPPADRRASATH